MRWRGLVLGAVIGIALAPLPAQGEKTNFNLGQYSPEGYRSMVSNDAKDHYVSVGREYLRQYLRENMLRFFSDRGVPVDVDQMQAATIDFKAFRTNDGVPLETRLRIWAAENLDDYIHCGRYLPIRLELESDYSLMPNMNVSARVRAPFDNVMQLELGSRIRWTEQWSSRFLYLLQNDSKTYGGFNLGIGWSSQDWCLALDYDITREAVQQQRFSVGRSF